MPRRAISSTVGWSTVAVHLVDEVGRRPRQRAVGAHPAGVRSGVAVAHPLEVLSRLQRHDGAAVGDREQRHLGAGEVLLDDDAAARRRVRPGLVAVLRHHDALAGREAVVLHDVRRADLVEGGVRSLRRVADEGPRRRDARSGHDVLGERLRPLEPGSGGAGPEAVDPAGPDGVGRTGDQGRLGTDDDQVGADGAGQVAARPRRRSPPADGRSRPRRCRRCPGRRGPR